jgi:hypothetical protein
VEEDEKSENDESENE